MGKKSTLAMYRARNRILKKSGYSYMLTPGAAHCFLRAGQGFCGQKTYRAKIEGVDLFYTACKIETVIMEHIVLRCKNLRPALTQGTEVDIKRALGYPDENG